MDKYFRREKVLGKAQKGILNVRFVKTFFRKSRIPTYIRKNHSKKLVRMTRYLIAVTSSPGRTYRVKKKLKQNTDRDIFAKTSSP